MDGKLVGVHRVKMPLKNGEVTYYYAWRGGPRILSKPGTKAFTQEFVRLTRQRPQPASAENTVGWLCDEFQASANYQKLRASTRRDYERIIGAIKVEFGSMPLPAVEAKGARAIFLKWRDGMADAPRSADMHVVVLARVLSWGKDREDILRNPLVGVEKLSRGSRKDVVWLPSQLATYLAHGKPHLVAVVKFALWTMQRQGDILTMPTIAYDDGKLWITQGKTGARVRVAAPAELLPMLEEAKAATRQRILNNSYGQNWTSDGFRASLSRDMKRLGIKGVTFHDLRGTGITYAYANGADIERIAEISGHSKTECEEIIRKHYLAGADVIEAIRAGTNGA